MYKKKVSTAFFSEKLATIMGHWSNIILFCPNDLSDYSWKILVTNAKWNTEFTSTATHSRKTEVLMGIANMHKKEKIIILE